MDGHKHWAQGKRQDDLQLTAGHQPDQPQAFPINLNQEEARSNALLNHYHRWGFGLVCYIQLTPYPATQTPSA
jgi:hypothetical protein